MKIISAIVTISALAATSALGEGALDGEPSVTVYIRYNDSMAPATLRSAQAISRAIFAKAGVHLNWRMDRSEIDKGCTAIVIDVTSNTPGALHPGAFAYAEVYEGVHIRIFCDRVLQKTHDAGVINNLLAHVMVHEITHMLEGVSRHSQEGIMKARWTNAEILQMRWRPLSFAPQDLDLISHAFIHRQQASGNSGDYCQGSPDTISTH